MSSRGRLSTALLAQLIPRAVKHRTLLITFFAIAILFFEALTGLSTVHASYCQITNVSYNYPGLVMPGQKFSVSTTVTGSCAAGDDYNYSVRADVIDRNSGKIISSSRSRILGYNTSNFIVTVPDSVTAPALATAAWNIEVAVAVFHTATTGLQDSTSMSVRDYSTVGYATIQVGSYQPVPEFAVGDPALVLAFVIASLLSIWSRRMLNEKRKRARSYDASSRLFSFVRTIRPTHTREDYRTFATPIPRFRFSPEFAKRLKDLRPKWKQIRRKKGRRVFAN